MKIAVLENDTRAAQLLEDWLAAAGHEVRFFASSAAFGREVDAATFDAAIVGSTVDGADLAELCGQLRAGISRVPLIRILQKGSEQDVVAALRAGAEDCMPVLRQQELLARLDVLLRRSRAGQPQREEVLTYGNLVVDVRNRVIMRDGVRVTLTPKTYNLAVFLLSNAGKLLARAYLLEHIWGRDKNASTRTLDTHVSRLRTVLGLTPEHGWQLQSVYQHGYRLDRMDKARSGTRDAGQELLAAA